MSVFSRFVLAGAVAIACVACSATSNPDDTTGATPQMAAATAQQQTRSAPTAMQTPASGSEQALMAQAKVSRANAERTALARVPGGTIRSAELEEEHALLVWSFDIATRGSMNITEIQVDARSGGIVSKELETPKDQAEEIAADMQTKSAP